MRIETIFVKNVLKQMCKCLGGHRQWENFLFKMFLLFYYFDSDYMITYAVSLHYKYIFGYSCITKWRIPYQVEGLPRTIWTRSLHLSSPSQSAGLRGRSWYFQRVVLRMFWQALHGIFSRRLVATCQSKSLLANSFLPLQQWPAKRSLLSLILFDTRGRFL